jgi:Mrp family chromosome partitioning ATPase
VIGVSSSVGGEGAHRVARALADASAGDPNGHVLLIDFNGHSIPEAPTGRGLVDVITGEADPQDVVASVGDLYLMGKGSQECPAYLWNSERMQTVIADLRGRFKRIVFHVPPVLNTADAVNLARHADGMVLSIKADSTRREVVMRAMEIVAEAKGRVVGAVLLDRRQVIPKAVYKRI